jgi:antitoxin (DNA-binding transcriptional repressor) of toxin-antitoxin stability system
LSDLEAWSGWYCDEHDHATACAAAVKIAAQRETLVKELNIREMRASLGQLAELVATEGELVIRRRGEPIARVLPMTHQRRPPDHADLRRRMPLLKTSSADLIRAERDEC